MVDDSLIKDVIAHGCLRPQTAKRVTQLVAAAEDAGADYILVTCSSIGKAVETAAGLSLVPVLRVDPREKNGYRFWSARRWRSIIWRRFSRNPLGD